MIAECQILVQGRGVDLGPVQERQQALDLGGEGELVADLTVVEGLLAQMVAGGEQALLGRIPDREGEHAAQPVEAGLAQLLVEVQHDLGVGAGAEAVALGLQLGHQLPVVVDLAVADDPLGAVLVADRLPAALEVDDREPAMAQHPAIAAMRGTVVGSPVAQRVQHAADHGRIGPAPTHHTRDAAHLLGPH